MIVWLCTTLYVLITCTSAMQFRLGMLSPYNHTRLGWTSNAAAATMAIERSQSEGLLQGHNITVIWRDDKCNALGGAGSAVLLKEVDDIDAFIGPPCSSSTTPSGLLASHWNLPMFSHAAADPSLANKKVYNTLVRLGPSFNRLGQALVEIFHHYSWTRVFMISGKKKVFCDYSSRAANVIFPANNITVAEWMIIDDGIDDSTIDDILNRIKQRSRIVLLCTENSIDRRNILLKAKIAGMMDGNYVFWMSHHMPSTDVTTPWIKNEPSDDDAKLAVSHVLQITVAEVAGPDVEAFRDMIPIKMAESPWFYNDTARPRGSLYSPFLHDVVYLYLLILNETLSLGENHRNGTAFFHKAQGKTFKGITGNIKVDSNGDREPDYWVWALTPNSDEFHVALEARMTSPTENIRMIKEIVWSTVDGKPPLDKPLCCFSNELCPSQKTSVVVWVSVMVVLAVIVLLIVAYFVYRHKKLEWELDRRTWVIKEADLKLTNSKCIGSFSQMSFRSVTTNSSSDIKCRNRSNSAIGENQIFSTIGIYKNTMVTIKKLQKENISLSRKQHVQLKLIKELTHENVNRFIGVCIASKFPCYLTVYCNKGSIQDIVENDDIKLDWVFKKSIITDLTNGLHYLHSSPLKIHGNLKSSNCVVDNRWVLKLTDFGLLDFMQQNVDADKPQYKAYFWTAPEVLRQKSIVNEKCDIYSLGIILYEILNRTSPYDTTSLTPKEILEKIIEAKECIFRPLIHAEASEENALAGLVIKLMQDCWSEYPEQRPDTSSVKQSVLKLNKGTRVNIVDNMIILLERYANNLEKIVEQRTSELVQERQKSDLLLCRMLPPPIADKLKKNEIVLPEMYESVTIYFSDIVGFTSIAAASTAMQIVDFLNDLYIIFDFVISKYEVYKIETIGDAYMVASGLPERNGDKHVTEIAEMALDLLNEIQTFTIRHLRGRECQIRIGLHTGPCAAGVVGLTMPRYCLFGDTVNMASRMESTGEASRIHISASTADNLLRHRVYNVIERGDMDIKGKGQHVTYWLCGKDRENNLNSPNALNIDLTKDTGTSSTSNRCRDLLKPVPVKIDLLDMPIPVRIDVETCQNYTLPLK